MKETAGSSLENGCLGAEVDGAGLRHFLHEVLQANLEHENRTGQRPTPLCIWGMHGLGKTQIVMDYAKEMSWKVAYCAPAQFEEMGDLHGLPARGHSLAGDSSKNQTVYLPPEWVPTEPGPGILLLDDLNRADDRILRGTMQLLQNFEMFSWVLPPRWQIIATANPDSGDYSVTPFDPAMLTRMLHITLIFNQKSWSEWAIKSNVDPRGINFVLTYPESVTGKRTTPRSLVHFFHQLKSIPNLIEKAERVSRLAHACLDETTVSSFLAFVQESLSKLPSPENFLSISAQEEAEEVLRTMADGGQGTKRVDLLSTFITRMILYLKTGDGQEGGYASKNLAVMLLSSAIPADLRFSFHRELSQVAMQDLKGSGIANEAVALPEVQLAILQAV
jgi:MoxR-like ATPase